MIKPLSHVVLTKAIWGHDNRGSLRLTQEYASKTWGRVFRGGGWYALSCQQREGMHDSMSNGDRDFDKIEEEGWTIIMCLKDKKTIYLLYLHVFSWDRCLCCAQKDRNGRFCKAFTVCYNCDNKNHIQSHCFSSPHKQNNQNH